ncbi:MAG: class I SAM-dependent methyltransferase [Candidatus Omnitrophica bacterium]|nr:class I SAM-dependent methyltransferase [Candidatus Omnitrophota bacterium]
MDQASVNNDAARLMSKATETGTENRRITREKSFHDAWASTINLDELLVRETFESPTAVENQYALNLLGNLTGKKILDLGCGAGETSVYFALLGAETYACDISQGFLDVAKKLAEKFNVHINFSLAEASALPYPSGYFDCIFGNGILHHVNLGPAIKETHRVLKKSGTAVFIEPLPYNPIINIYRHMAKGVRTEDEKPLSFKQLNLFKGSFSSFSHREFWLFSLLIFLHFYLVRRWDPSKVRYWKKVIEEGPNYEKTFFLLQRIDHFFLKYAPFLRPLCWNTVIVANK